MTIDEWFEFKKIVEYYARLTFPTYAEILKTCGQFVYDNIQYYPDGISEGLDPDSHSIKMTAYAYGEEESIFMPLSVLLPLDARSDMNPYNIEAMEAERIKLMEQYQQELKAREQKLIEQEKNQIEYQKKQLKELIQKYGIPTE